ncbi:C-14 sterol reductase Erg24 [Schizosaccharomyces cryophilus OY26]|uniref:Delta(14)-sterol reductase n=1 Tax=Schizosaccharomyces cryophilus (strain OY26 / ATCC MYA-4695 / CBS 11777 / NBRC 106824 / NRRL Y48691) TaxID=653667 RepID=S9VQQ5_SCHCR|nr:C-14 sterol reductase Erg24 [Schizosaccharomyces cryophilus OY26]EPY50268.1 C-14 sterol reductase Erg24 [Schizosaccharomyces cryophilus OY26]
MNKKAGNFKKEPKEFEYEFFGPTGALAVFLLTTVVLFGLYFGCNENGCPAYPQKILSMIYDAKFIDVYSFQLYLCWLGALILAWHVLPGEWVKGTPIDEKGSRLDYKMNGFATASLVLGVTSGFIYMKGPECMELIWSRFLPLMTSAYIVSIFLSIYCYISSFIGQKRLAEGGNSGNIVYDWFIGRLLNPRIGNFDIKVFSELRPGLILWVLLDIAFACRQYVLLNGRITDSMVLVLVFHSWYVLDSLFYENAVLTTMDVTTDGLGYMLCLGNLAWVPFTYGLQARYLSFHPVDLGIPCTIAIIFLQLLGYYIFRGTNSQKNMFRNNPTDPSVKNLKYMETKRGTKLLIDGWYGKSRHINYFGDWLMAWAWCLPVGFGSAIPYFYVAYFAVLLIHRYGRDDHKCHQKYGEDWNKYCQIVKYRIIPYVY